MEHGATPISRTTIIVALVCSGIVLALGQAVLYWRGFQQQESNKWVTHTYQIIQSLTAIKAGMGCGETVVSLAAIGAENLALPLDGCIERARRGYETGLRLTVDSPEQHRRMLTIGRQMERRIDLLKAAFADAPSHREDEATRRTGLKLTSEIYANVNAGMSAEQTLLELRLRRSAEQATTVRDLSISTAAFSLLLMMLAFALFHVQGRQLREIEAQRRLILDNAPIGMVIVSLDGRLLRTNNAMCQMLGYRPEELPQQSLEALSDPHDREEDLRLSRKLIDKELNSFEVTRRYRHRDGHLVWSIVSVSLVRDDRDHPDFFVAQVQDISRRVQAEAQANLFFERSIDMLAIFDKHGAFERVNRTWSRVLGWSESELVGHRFIELVHPEDRARTIEEYEGGAKHAGSIGFRNRYLTPSGAVHWLEWSVSPIADDRLFGVARDVTKQIELEEAIRQASIVDELTGLHNRRGFMLLGEQQIRSGQRYHRPLFMVFADLDGLKKINDRLGHEAGDRALVEMAEVLRATFRSSDVAARLGGDEFVVLAEGDAQVADRLAQRLLTAMQRHNTQPDRTYELSASLGVALYDEAQPCSLTDLIAMADKRMYDAKRRIRSTG